MTNEEVIEQLSELAKSRKHAVGDDRDVEALMRAFAAVVRLTPVTPEPSSSGVFGICPNCEAFLDRYEQSHGNIEIPHCKWCGQVLDWSETL